jgi:hypothetical protein
MPTIGQIYRWSDLPGSGHGYVRFKNGRAVCAILKPELNPDAPKFILVGEGLLRERWARILCEQNRKAPFEVYLKAGTNRWKYEGIFVVEDWSEAIKVIQEHEAKANRNDVFRVIKLRKK